MSLTRANTLLIANAILWAGVGVSAAVLNAPTFFTFVIIPNTAALALFLTHHEAKKLQTQ